VAFWAAAGAMQLLYVLIFVSLFSLIIPAKLLQLSTNPKFYERLGIKFIRKLVQNGDYANRLIRKKNPQYKLIKSKDHARRYMHTVKMYERYHFLFFIFFLLTSLFALIITQYAYFVVIMLANIVYNVSPILLQQYNRARLLRLYK
jgi:hypothetical protein